MELNMKMIKTVAIGACALVALGAGVSSATAGPPTKTKAHVITTAGSCDGGTAGKVAIAGGVARLRVPEQNSWAQIRAYPTENLTLSQLNKLSFRSNASDAGVVWAKITTDHGSVVFSPNTQPGGEKGVGEWATHDVRYPNATVRYDDDAGWNPDVSWETLLVEAGDYKVTDVRVTAGCANPVGDDGAQVQVDDLTINNQVIGFN
jgi:hypothetical protein